MKSANEQAVNLACSRCIMDDAVDSTLTIDENGVCNHCSLHDVQLSSRVLKGEEGQRAMRVLIEKIKLAGKRQEYDCIIGVSGGVDSTYVAYLVKQLGLRPLAIHFDNGWDSELAVKNIERVLRNLEIDLHTYVVDWEEFKDLQLSFLRASVPDGEIPTDHAINALLWREACVRGIKYIVTGMNFATESIGVPDWAYGHSDWRYIKDVHRHHGTAKLRTYPHFSLAYLFYVNVIRHVRTVSILNYVDYHKEEAMKLLHDQLEWQYYGGKHHESIYTRFYQGYVLPKKFRMDKRYGHLSALINAGQMTREQALEEIRLPPYPEALQQQDLEYVTKKLGLDAAEFDQIMRLPIKSFRDYRNTHSAVQFLRRTVNRLRKLGIYPR